MAKKQRGFGSMDPEEHSRIAKLGGSAVPAEKRSFSTDPQLASRAGSIGGKASVEAKRRRKAEQQESKSKQ